MGFDAELIANNGNLLTSLFEDFRTYFILDTDNKLTIEPTTGISITAEDLQRNRDAYVGKDFGVANFKNNYEINVRHIIYSTTENGGLSYPLNLANNKTTVDDWVLNGNQFQGIQTEMIGGNPILFLGQNNTVFDFMVLPTDTILFFKLFRNNGIGPFGTLFCLVSLNEFFTPLLNTLSIPLIAKVDFRYAFFENVFNSNLSNNADHVISHGEIISAG